MAFIHRLHRGSSPHTRGARKARHLRPLPLRDHPRIRGEHASARAVRWARRGSSPHTRGAPYRTFCKLLKPGIIPAYAGSTQCTRLNARFFRDHPRIRGEHDCLDAPVFDAVGSSPHTRGAPASSKISQLPGGIIPAYAGSTNRYFLWRAGRRDHPRIRGEHVAKVHRGVMALGIIPAYAGSTFLMVRETTPSRDHPRIRGEHWMHCRGHRSIPGSSPHTRGAPATLENANTVTGIIPAYAGSTSVHVILDSAGEDHPRIRGEHIYP